MSDLTTVILEEVGAEREDQVARGFGPAHDEEHTHNDWVAYICAYAGRGVNRHYDEGSHRFRKQMVKVAALAVAAIEMVDVGELRS
jgi:hypothetical protein